MGEDIAKTLENYELPDYESWKPSLQSVIEQEDNVTFTLGDELDGVEETKDNIGEMDEETNEGASTTTISEAE